MLIVSAMTNAGYDPMYPKFGHFQAQVNAQVYGPRADEVLLVSEGGVHTGRRSFE